MNKKTEESRIAYNKIAFEYDTSREGQYTRNKTRLIDTKGRNKILGKPWK